MTYFLYIPIAKKNVSSDLKLTIRNWVQAENKKEKQVVVTYLGEKRLENLPPHAKIYVVAPGSAIEPNNVERSVTYETASSFPSLQGQYYLFEGTHQRLFVPKIAQDMIADGLFSEKTSEQNIRIKLFFLNAGKQARRLAQVFQEVLMQKKPAAAPVNFRVDYYPANRLKTPQITEELPHKYAENTAKNGLFRAKDLRASLYSNQYSQPALSSIEVVEALEEYCSYKSSRFWGLSGFLGLNKLCSSNESAQAIRRLLLAPSNEERFSIAKHFVRQFPHNKLAKCLQEKVNNSENVNKEFWQPNLQLTA